MTGSNIDVILEEYPELYYEFILSDIDGFIKILPKASTLLDGESLKYIIESSDFTDEQKFEIYKRANGEQKLKDIKVDYPSGFMEILEKYKRSQKRKRKKQQAAQQKVEGELKPIEDSIKNRGENDAGCYTSP